MKKRIAIVGVGMLSDGTNQGIPAFIEALKVLSEQYYITVYSFIPVDKKNAPSGIRVRCVTNVNMPQRLQYVYLGLLFFVDHLRNKYALIHAQSPYPAGVFSLFFSRQLKIPWILSFHAGEAASMPDIPFGDLLHPVLSKACHEVSQYADKIMAMSVYQADIIKRNLNLNRDIFVLPRGVAVSDSTSNKQITSPLILLHISNYHPVKDPDTLLKTFKKISDSIAAKLIIAGCNYPDVFSEEIKNLNLSDKVELVGKIPHREMRLLFDKSHILLHTSRFEGLPMVALEAMANHVVVCATHVGVMADLSGSCCITVAPGDYESLANEVLSLVHNKSQYLEIRTRAHAWIKDHDMTWYISELNMFYKQLMAK